MNAGSFTSGAGDRISLLTGTMAVIYRFIRNDDAQDVIEYAFLAAFFGIAGYLTLGAIGGEVLTTYSSWVDPSIGLPKLWDPSDALVSSGS
jgi:Flp pilus assembly pilin Flp